MSETPAQLKRIQDKLQQLLKQHSNLQKENMRLREQINEYNTLQKIQQESLENLQRQVDVLKLHTGEMTEADKKDLEKRINAYLKEIDRCIALLGE